VTGTNMPSATHPLQAASLTGHDAFVEGVEFSSNGKYIMSSSSGNLQLFYANHCHCCGKFFAQIYLAIPKEAFLLKDSFHDVVL